MGDFEQQLVTTPNIQQKDTTFTKIFVGGLPYHTNDKSLRKFFENFGDIEEAVVITDRQTGKSRGYGFVTMSDKEAAERAVKDPNPIIDGRKANVNLAYVGAKVRPNAQNGFSHLRSPAYPLMIPSQYRTSPCLQYDNGEYVFISLPSQYLYPSAAYLPAPGLILSNPTAAHAPLSTAAAAGNPLYTEYATAYTPQYANGLEIGYAPFAAAPLATTSGAHHHLTNGAGTAALPSYLPPATHSPAAYAYTLQAPPHHQPIPTGAPAHFPVPYPAPPQEPRMP